MTGDRLQQTAETLNQATHASRTSVTVQTTIVAGTEPAPGRARDPLGELRIRTLTKRERELLGLLANGWSNRLLRDTLDEDDGDTLGGDDLGLVMVMASVAAVLIQSPPGMGHPWSGADDQPLGESGASRRPPVSAAMTCHGDAARTPSWRVSAAAACPSASTASASTEPRGGIGPRLGSAR